MVDGFPLFLNGKLPHVLNSLCFRNMMHQDIKCLNIYLIDTFEIKIIEFGELKQSLVVNSRVIWSMKLNMKKMMKIKKKVTLPFRIMLLTLLQLQQCCHLF